jgi:hypothetical protein
MHRAVRLAVLVFAIVFMGCGGGGGGGGQRSQLVIPATSGNPIPSTSNSGIEVSTFATRIDTATSSLKFDREPLPNAGIEIHRTGDNAFIVRGATDSAGRVRFALDPGEYTVIPQSVTVLNDTFQAVVQNISVSAGAFASAQIEYESVKFGFRL